MVTPPTLITLGGAVWGRRHLQHLASWPVPKPQCCPSAWSSATYVANRLLGASNPCMKLETLDDLRGRRALMISRNRQAVCGLSVQWLREKLLSVGSVRYTIHCEEVVETLGVLLTLFASFVVLSNIAKRHCHVPSWSHPRRQYAVTVCTLP